MGKVTIVANGTIDFVKGEILRVFGKTTQPAQDNIAIHDCPECDGIRNDFAGVEWQKINPKLLERNYDKLSLFTAEAFHYFLPAFLLYSINNLDDLTCTVTEFTLYSLTPDKSWKDRDGQISAYYRERFAKFSIEQMEVIYQFLILMDNGQLEFLSVAGAEKRLARLRAIREEIANGV